MKETQCQKILRYMKQNGGITQMDAMEHFRCYRLAARIADLRTRGYSIITDKSEAGSYAIYRLAEGGSHA